MTKKKDKDLNEILDLLIDLNKKVDYLILSRKEEFYGRFREGGGYED